MIGLSFEIKLVRQAHKSMKKWARKTVRYHPRRVQPDRHNGEEVPGNNSRATVRQEIGSRLLMNLKKVVSLTCLMMRLGKIAARFSAN